MLQRLLVLVCLLFAGMSTHCASHRDREDDKEGDKPSRDRDDAGVERPDAQIDERDAACAVQSAEATLVTRPVDIIVAIDNSGSMGEEISGVERNINQNFANILEHSGLDYRVILVSQYRTSSSTYYDLGVCVEAPLGGTPTGGCSSPPSAPANNAPKFFHYARYIDSNNAWCVLEDTLNSADDYGLAPRGWYDWLRPEAFKIFVVISDDSIYCSTARGSTYSAYDYWGSTSGAGETAAAQFEADLFRFWPEQFGSAEERNYQVYSIVAIGYNSPPSAPYEPSDPLNWSMCPTGATAGYGHQELSIRTGGLRFPICDTSSYDVVFQAIAQGVVTGARVACEFEVPEPPEGATIDISETVLEYTPSDGSSPVRYGYAASESRCDAGSFYEEGGLLHLCPAACETVQADSSARLSIVFGCDAILY